MEKKISLTTKEKGEFRRYLSILRKLFFGKDNRKKFNPRSVDSSLRTIYQYFKNHPREEYTVTDLYVKFRIEQPVMSHKLRDLRTVKAVKRKREGKFIYYSLHPRFEDFREVLEQVLVEHFKEEEDVTT